MNKIIKQYNTASSIPGGMYIFNYVMGRRSPYVYQLKPKLRALREGFAEIEVKDRKAVRNHIGSIDSNAMFTLVQFVMGVSLESIIPQEKRWIPLGAEVKYLKLAKTNVYATCDTTKIDFNQDLPIIRVEVRDKREELVQEAKVQIRISNKSTKKN